MSDITWDFLFTRIENDPIKHLGGLSPHLLSAYFSGYELARSFHRREEIGGDLSLGRFGRWFTKHAYAGPQGYASFCVLLTDTEEDALKLFFEFRKLASKDIAELEPATTISQETRLSIVEFLKMDAIRKRPAMYFSNDYWLPQMWAMCNGYVVAEQDIGKESSDARTLLAFERWIWERYPFAEGKNWGKLFQFLAMGVLLGSLELFYDEFELFLDGGSTTDKTQRFQKFLDDAVASALANDKDNGQS
jgi:hypothetical protein